MPCADFDNLRSNYSSVNRDVFLNGADRTDAADGSIDAKVDELLEALASEPDYEKRQTQAAEVVQNYLVEQAYVLPFFEEPQVFASAAASTASPPNPWAGPTSTAPGWQVEKWIPTPAIRSSAWAKRSWSSSSRSPRRSSCWQLIPGDGVTARFADLDVGPLP